jgi:restriction system protein
MPIPAFDALMLPVLRRCAEKAWAVRDLVARIADDLQLSEEERGQRTGGGSNTVITNKVNWARYYLKQAGLLDQPKHGFVRITQRGRELLDNNPPQIDMKLLEQFQEFRAFLDKTKSDNGSGAGASATDGSSRATPEEQIEAATKILDEALRDALLAQKIEIKRVDMDYFEEVETE